MLTFLFIIYLLILCTGFIGCIIPVIPGPILSYTAILLMQYTGKEQPFSNLLLVILGVATIIASVLDNILPIWGAKIFGATKKGIIGSIAGMFVGMIFFPPFGLIIGLLIGAIIGELIAGTHYKKALGAGTASFLASIAAIFIKLLTCLILGIFFFRGMLIFF